MAGPKTSAAADAADLARATSIVPETINEEFVAVPGDLAYYGGRWATAHEEKLRAEHARERLEAELRQALREQKNAGVLKASEDAIADMVEASPAYVLAREREIAADAAKTRIGVVIDAIRAKKDALISLGAQLRAERDEISIRERR